MLGRTFSKCDAVAGEIRGRGAEAIALQCDIEHRDQIEASVERTVAEWGRLDLLANNAQTKVFQSIRRMTDAEMETMSQSGPMASFRFMQVCFAYLREAKGCVINMGSGSGIMPHGAMSGYPLGHWGDAEADIGRGVVYLAGPDGRYITATTLMIDGGYNYLR